MSLESTQDTPHWYALHTHPNQEGRAYGNLIGWNIEAFAPRIKERRFNPFSGVPTLFTRPLFPRYIFARFSVEALLHKIMFTRGVASVVSFGGRPTPVADEIIEVIQLQVGEDGCVKIGDTLKYGDRVVIKEGPLKNFVGVFEREFNQSERVRLLLTAVSYQSHIEVERAFVKKVS